MSSVASYDMFVRQQPEAARACGSASIPDRRPIDPVVILQLRHMEPGLDTAMMSTALFCYASIEKQDSGRLQSANRDLNRSAASLALLTGTITSSICYMKDPGAHDMNGAFFVFPDLSIRLAGDYNLQFDLFSVTGGFVKPLARCTSNLVTVYSAKRFPGMTDSTELTRNFANQGLKLRLRKAIREKKRKCNLRTKSYPSNASEILALHNFPMYCDKMETRGFLPPIYRSLNSVKHRFIGSAASSSKETYGKSISELPHWSSLAHIHLLPEPISPKAQQRVLCSHEHIVEAMSISIPSHTTQLEPMRASSLRASEEPLKNLPSFDEAFPDFRHITSQHNQRQN